MKKLLTISAIHFVGMLFLSGCTGGDFNGTGVRGTTDTTAPTVVYTYPTAGATNVSASPTIWVQFSEPIDSFSLSATTFTLTDGVNSVSGQVAMSGETWGYFDPYIFSQTVPPLQYNTTYTATITTGVTDLAGNSLAANYTWTFTTTSAPDTTPPLVITKSPAAGATNVSINTTVTAGFSEALNAGTITTATFTLASASAVVSTVTYSNAIATLTPSAALASNTTYTATLTTGVADLAGNALAAANTWSFTTAPTPSITTTTLPNGTETGAYSQTLTATGGITPYVWSSPTPTTMPSGLSLSAAGVLSGTLAPGTSAGSPYTISVRLTDADGLTANKSFTLTVGAGPSVVENTLAQGTTTGAYTQTLTGTGGTGPYTWSAAGLPGGVSLSTAGPSATTTLTSGAILASSGTYTITVTVTDANALASNKSLALIVNAVPSITTASLTDASVGVAYGPVTLAASNGTTPYSSWTATGLPTGLSFNTSTGTISGTPTGPAGNFNIGFTVDDANLVTSATTTLSMTVRPVITTASLLAGTETATYSQTLAASGGTAPYAWSTPSVLPSGLTLVGDTLSGTLGGFGTAGTYPIALTATDANLISSPTVTLSLVVNAVPTVTAIQADLDAVPATNNVNYVGFTPSSSGGTAPMTWTVTGLPLNMSYIPATGAIGGTPVAGAGSYPIGFTFTDDNLVSSGTVTLNLTVN